MQRANSRRPGRNANAIGAGEMLYWRITGELAGVHVTRRYRAPNSDAAKKQANDHGMRVDTCEPMQTRK